MFQIPLQIVIYLQMFLLILNKKTLCKIARWDSVQDHFMKSQFSYCDAIFLLSFCRDMLIEIYVHGHRI